MPNRTIPELWKNDLTLNSLSSKAELLFRKIYHVICDDHRFEIGPSPTRPLVLHAELFALRPSQRLTDTTHQLHELQMAGVILVRDSERGWYGEIIERLRYRAEDYAKGAARHGPRTKKPPEQAEMPLGPMGVVKPARVSPPTSKPYESESGNGTVHESACREVTRAQSRGGDSEKRAAGDFSATRTEFADPLWVRLWDEAGADEMFGNGAAWVGRFQFCPDTIRTILSDLDRAKKEMVVKKAAALLQEFWNQSSAAARMRSSKHRRYYNELRTF